jgi:DNA-directed RNA polymerase specialized sigma24 family protein
MPLPPFQATLDEHRDAVARFLVATVGRQEADDCLQETMLSALRAYPRLRPGSNIRAWLLTIARNKALDSHRARKRQPVPVGDAVDGGGWADGGFDGEPDAELWAAVRELPPKQRSAVVLRFVNDLSHREIATVLDCSEAAARRSLHEGLTKLRETWT